MEEPLNGPVAKELLRAVMSHTNLTDPPTYNAPSLANDAFLIGYRAAGKAADERDRMILLTGLLERAREYVADALGAMHHTDGADLLAEIDATISRRPK